MSHQQPEQHYLYSSALRRKYHRERSEHVKVICDASTGHVYGEVDLIRKESGDNWRDTPLSNPPDKVRIGVVGKDKSIMFVSPTGRRNVGLDLPGVSDGFNALTTEEKTRVVESANHLPIHQRPLTIRGYAVNAEGLFVPEANEPKTLMPRQVAALGL